MTRADHPSGSDRIFEAMESLDPEGHHDVVVNVQGDFPDHRPARHRGLDPAAGRPRRRYRHARLRDRARRRSTIPTSSRRWAARSRRGGCGRSTSPAPPRPGAKGRSIITSGSTPIAAGRSSASSPCRPRRWNARAARAAAGAGGGDAHRRDHRRRRALRRRHSPIPRNAPAQSSRAARKREHEMTKNKIAYQGEPGANSHIACIDVYPGLDAASLPDLRGRLRGGRGGAGAARDDPDREFRRRSRRGHPPPAADLRLHIVGEYFLPIHHQLMAVKGASLATIRSGAEPCPRARPVPPHPAQARPGSRRRGRRYGGLGAPDRGS
jgi:prephenate dehydratase